jgi:hypothetical protein
MLACHESLFLPQSFLTRTHTIVSEGWKGKGVDHPLFGTIGHDVSLLVPNTCKLHAQHGRWKESRSGDSGMMIEPKEAVTRP